MSNITAQTSWKGTVSTNWSSPSNWTAGIPNSTVDAIIGDANFTGSFQPSLTTPVNCKSLIIGSSTKVSTLTVTKNITISGNVTIGGNGTILHTGAGTSISIKGNWNNAGTYSASNATAVVTFLGTTQTLTGVTAFQRLAINAGSLVTLANNISINTMLTVNGSLDPTASCLVSGNATLTVNSAGVIFVKTLNFTNNYSLSGTITLNATSTVNYASSVINQNITNILTYGYLHVSGGMTKTLTGNLPALNSSSSSSGKIYIDAGTLDLLTFTANRGNTNTGGSVIVAAGAKLRIGGTTTFPSNYSTISLSTTSTVEYYGNNQIVLAAAYGNLSFSGTTGAVVKTMPATAITISGNLTSTVGTGTSVTFFAAQNITVNGNVVLDAASTFDGGTFTHKFISNWNNSGTFNGNTSTVTFSGTNVVLSGTGTNNFYNLAFTATGINASGNTSINVSGNISTSLTANFIHSTGGSLTMSGTGKTISGPGLLLYNCIITGSITTASNITISGNLSVNNSFAASAGTITFNGVTKTISGNGAITFFALSILGTISTASNYTLLSNLSVASSGSFTATAGTTTMNGTTALSGTANLFNVTINATKTVLLGSNATLCIANVFTKTGTLNVTTNIPNTVVYNSPTAQSLVNTTYHNLILSNGGIKTPIDELIINNDFTINFGVTFDASSFTHTIYRHFTNSGTFTDGTSTIQLLGGNSATIAGATEFNNLIVNKNSLFINLTLSNNITVTNLTVTNGTIQTGTNAVTITDTRIGAGIIIGTITHNHTFIDGTAYYFESAQNAITFINPSVSLTSVTEVVTLANVPDFNVGQECLNREYNITIPAGTFSSSTLRLHYDHNELNAVNEPNLNEFNYNSDSNVWDSIGYTTKDTALNFVEKTGISALEGRWTLAGIKNVVRWNGSVSSAWENAANWTTISGESMANRIPTSTDEAQIGQTGFIYNPTISSTRTVSVLQYGSIQASTLTLISGSLSILGAVNGNWIDPASHVIDVSSNALIIGTNINLSDGTNGHDIQLKIGNGSVMINNDLNQSATGSINFTGNGTLTINGAYNYTSGSFTAGSGTVIYSGTERQIVAPVIYNNLSIEKSTERAKINFPTVINGNLSTGIGGELAISDTLTVAGNISIGSNTNFIEFGARINLMGSWTNNGTFTTNSGSVNFNGTTDQFVNANTFNILIVNKPSGSLSLSGNLIINSDLLISKGTMDLAMYNANRSNPGGTFMLDSASYLKVGGATNFPTNFITNVMHASSTVEFNGTMHQHILATEFGNLLISNGGSNKKHFHLRTVLIKGDLTINSGATIYCDSNIVTVYGNLTNNGTYSTYKSTLILSGISKTFSGNATLDNLVASGGSYTFLNSNISISGDFFVDTLSSVNWGSSTVSFNGDCTNKGTLFSSGAVTFTGTRVQTLQLINAMTSTSTGVINFNGTVAPILNSNTPPIFATVNINNTAGITASEPWSVYGSFTVGAGATFNGGSLKHTFYGNFTNNGNVISNYKIYFMPQPPFSAEATIRLDDVGGSFLSTGEVEFGGTEPITILDNAPVFNFLEISNTNTTGITPPNSWNLQDVLIGTGSTFNAGTSLSHTIAGNFTNNGVFNGNTSTVTFTGNPVVVDGTGIGNYYNLTIATGADLTYNKPLTIGGNLILNGNLTTTGQVVTFFSSTPATINSTLGSITFDHLEQNKPGSTTTLLIPLTVTGSLTMTDGIINTTSTNILTLTDNATSTAGTNTSFVNGPMKKIGNQAFVFPIGKGSTWARLGIGTPSDATDAFTAQYFDTPYVDFLSMATIPAPVLNNVSIVEYWTCDRNTGTSDVPVQLFWEDAARSFINNYSSDLNVAHWNGSAWENAGQSSITAASPGNITSDVMNSFSPFTFGSRIGLNPLPIKLLTFDAKLNSSKTVDLAWSTASEKNNDYFTIEKSIDAANFESVITIDGAGTSTNTLYYSEVDLNPYAGTSYYRLKQTDYDGNRNYSNIVSIDYKKAGTSVNIFPNPNDGNGFNILLTGNENEEILVVLYDATGQEVYSKIITKTTDQTITAIDPLTRLSSGVYMVTATSKNEIIHKRLVVK
ncbi:MAG: hypothetical protein A3F72_03125 [Bacteroidetes bacterium RIFCSPLOWO2_12_FULL_35_15]|nr:MAG: hypothetical protein A3F72_03125 [Bacteroidetes bacterium RIFCSPLOWO2_12_FULL_35_15]